MSPARHRGKQRATANRDLLKTTITLPPHILRELDLIVLHYKDTEQNFNRSALIQRIIERFLDPKEPTQ